ncbi:hypothetical protein L9F63_013129, partial [Diploptera punctata]
MSIYNFEVKARCVHSAMKPVFFISKCFGLIYFKYHRHEGTVFNELYIPLLIYNALLLVIADSVYLFYVTNWIRDSMHSVVSFSIILQSLCSVACNLIAIYISLMKSKTVLVIFNKLNSLHHFLKHSCSTYSKIKRNLILQIVLSTLGSVISLIVSWQSVGGHMYFIHLYLTFFINESCNLAMEMQYLGFVQVLEQHFVNVNRFLLTSCRITRKSVVTIVKYHDCLCDVINIINSTYSLFVLLNVTKIFMSLSGILFIVLIRQYTTELQNYVGLLNTKNQVGPWCMLLTAKLIFMVITCSSATQEVS